MDWSRIKTIFILTFLALDIYLLYEFFKLLDSNKYEFITETSFEEMLEADHITYVELPKVLKKDSYIIAKPKTFKNEELEKIKGVNFTIIDGTVLQGELEEPVKLGKNFQLAEVQAFVKSKILYGDKYQYFNQSEEGHIFTFYQQFEGKTFYKNMSGKLTLYINDDNEIFSFTQTMLEDIKRMSDTEEEVLPPIKAIETLYDNGLLQPNSRITKVELGYFTLVQLTSSQVLTPTWRFVVNDGENLFVNAFEGQIIQLDDTEEKNLVE
jgi:regulatory protein YycI of two-component signal transduction system YycFG